MMDISKAREIYDSHKRSHEGSDCDCFNPLLSEAQGFLEAYEQQEKTVEALRAALDYAGLELVDGIWKAQFYRPDGSRVLLPIDEWKLKRREAAEEISRLQAELEEKEAALKRALGIITEKDKRLERAKREREAYREVALKSYPSQAELNDKTKEKP